MEEKIIIETLTKQVEELSAKLNSSIKYSNYLAECMGKIINTLEENGMEYTQTDTTQLLSLNKLDPSNKLGLK